MFMPFDLFYFVIIAPALLLAFWAQYRVRSTYAQAQEEPAALSGAAAARYVLDSAGLQQVGIEEIPGELSDHYDPREKVLRLSPGVYRGRSMAAVGIAAHEAGHAIQDARHYAPLVVRNAAVPVANFGGGMSTMVLLIGLGMGFQGMVLLGIALFATVVFFQVINLPVEFDASARAKKQLVELGIVPAGEMRHVNRVLNAAAMTYVAATMQAVLTLLYYLMRFAGGSRDE